MFPLLKLTLAIHRHVVRIHSAEIQTEFHPAPVCLVILVRHLTANLNVL